MVSNCGSEIKMKTPATLLFAHLSDEETFPGIGKQQTDKENSCRRMKNELKTGI